MKKIIVHAIIAIAFFTAFTSCKKEVVTIPITLIPSKPEPPIEAGSVEQFLGATKLVPVVSEEPLEVGVNFKPSVSGYIRSFKLHVPDAGNYDVTLRKVSNDAIIISKKITISKSDSWKDSIAVSIPVEANTQYRLSTVTTSYYQFDFFKTSLPSTIGSISLANFNSYTPHLQSAFVITNKDISYGCLDFTFQKAS